MNTGERKARLLITDLETRGCDYTLLLWLRQPQLLLEDSNFAKQMRRYLQEHSLTLGNFVVSDQTYDFVYDFFETVVDHFNHTGIKKINPCNYIQEINKKGKERLLDRFNKGLPWPQPFQPYTFQTMGNGVLFCMYQTWQDAIIAQTTLLEKRVHLVEGCVIDVGQVYEHQWLTSQSFVRLIVDWEIMMKYYTGRMTVEQVEGIANAFPAWFINRMMQKQLIPSTAEVDCIVKCKSRDVKGDYKVSKHFVFGIAGSTLLQQHYNAQVIVFEEYADKIRQTHKDKSLLHISDDELQIPVWGVDMQLLKGQNGISTLFGIKKGDKTDSSFPRVVKRLVISANGCKSKTYKESKIDRYDIKTLGLTKSHLCMYRCSYTTPYTHTITYNNKLTQECKVSHLFYFQNQLHSSNKLDEPIMCF